jgi:hypothetical protein
MNLNEVQNAFGRQTPGGNNNGSNQSGGGTLLTVIVIGVVAYLGYKYLVKPTFPKIKPNEE